ncbi:unnamed protein product [Amoebophrya sp. A25]|nr:unnamed protein product [Amoebophrya sp. A25]|eukprot:GSA25T00005286001.1
MNENPPSSTPSPGAPGSQYDHYTLQSLLELASLRGLTVDDTWPKAVVARLLEAWDVGEDRGRRRAQQQQEENTGDIECTKAEQTSVTPPPLDSRRTLSKSRGLSGEMRPSRASLLPSERCYIVDERGRRQLLEKQPVPIRRDSLSAGVALQGQEADPLVVLRHLRDIEGYMGVDIGGTLAKLVLLMPAEAAERFTFPSGVGRTGIVHYQLDVEVTAGDLEGLLPLEGDEHEADSQFSEDVADEASDASSCLTTPADEDLLLAQEETQGQTRRDNPSYEVNAPTTKTHQVDDGNRYAHPMKGVDLKPAVGAHLATAASGALTASYTADMRVANHLFADATLHQQAPKSPRDGHDAPKSSGRQPTRQKKCFASPHLEQENSSSASKDPKHSSILKACGDAQHPFPGNLVHKSMPLFSGANPQVGGSSGSRVYHPDKSLPLVEAAGPFGVGVSVSRSQRDASVGHKQIGSAAGTESASLEETQLSATRHVHSAGARGDFLSASSVVPAVLLENRLAAGSVYFHRNSRLPPTAARRRSHLLRQGLRRGSRALDSAGDEHYPPPGGHYYTGGRKMDHLAGRTGGHHADHHTLLDETGAAVSRRGGMSPVISKRSVSLDPAVHQRPRSASTSREARLTKSISSKSLRQKSPDIMKEPLLVGQKSQTWHSSRASSCSQLSPGTVAGAIISTDLDRALHPSVSPPKQPHQGSLELPAQKTSTTSSRSCTTTTSSAPGKRNLQKQPPGRVAGLLLPREERGLSGSNASVSGQESDQQEDHVTSGLSSHEGSTRIAGFNIEAKRISHPQAKKFALWTTRSNTVEWLAYPFSSRIPYHDDSQQLREGLQSMSESLAEAPLDEMRIALEEGRQETAESDLDAPTKLNSLQDSPGGRAGVGMSSSSPHSFTDAGTSFLSSEVDSRSEQYVLRAALSPPREYSAKDHALLEQQKDHEGATHLVVSQSLHETPLGVGDTAFLPPSRGSHKSSYCSASSQGPFPTVVGFAEQGDIDTALVGKPCLDPSRIGADVSEKLAAGSSSGTSGVDGPVAEMKSTRYVMRFISGSTQGLERVVSALKTLAPFQHAEPRKVAVAGGGAHKYRALFKEALNLEFEAYREMQSIVEGLRFVLERPHIFRDEILLIGENGEERPFDPDDDQDDLVVEEVDEVAELQEDEEDDEEAVTGSPVREPAYEDVNAESGLEYSAVPRAERQVQERAGSISTTPLAVPYGKIDTAGGAATFASSATSSTSTSESEKQVWSSGMPFIEVDSATTSASLARTVPHLSGVEKKLSHRDLRFAGCVENDDLSLSDLSQGPPTGTTASDLNSEQALSTTPVGTINRLASRADLLGGVSTAKNNNVVTATSLLVPDFIQVAGIEGTNKNKNMESSSLAVTKPSPTSSSSSRTPCPRRKKTGPQKASSTVEKTQAMKKTSSSNSLVNVTKTEDNNIKVALNPERTVSSSSAGSENIIADSTSTQVNRPTGEAQFQDGGQKRPMDPSRKRSTESLKAGSSNTHPFWEEAFLLVNLGSGVSILHVTPDSFARVGGTGCGGGTFLGLTRLLCGTTDFADALELAMQGNADNVDTLVQDIYGAAGSANLGLPGNLTASNFGKVGTQESLHFATGEFSTCTPEGAGRTEQGLDASRTHHIDQLHAPVSSGVQPSAFAKMPERKDLARAVLQMVTQQVAVLALAYSQSLLVRHIIFVGGFFEKNHLAKAAVSRTMNNLNKRAFFVRHSDFLGAIGSLAYSMKLMAAGGVVPPTSTTGSPATASAHPPEENAKATASASASSTGGASPDTATYKSDEKRNPL